jgi:hypothetical protein
MPSLNRPIGRRKKPMLSEAIIGKIREYCGYPVDGKKPDNFPSSFRFYQAIGCLNYRLTILSQPEIKKLEEKLFMLERYNDAMVKAEWGTENTTTWAPGVERARKHLAEFTAARQQLCDFFQIPHGPLMYPTSITVQA